MLVESVHAKFNHVIITALGLLEEWSRVLLYFHIELVKILFIGTMTRISVCLIL